MCADITIKENCKAKYNQIYCLPTARLELAIFGLGDRRLIHWATRAVCMVGGESMLCQKALPPGKVGRVLSTLIKVTQPDLFYTAFGLAS